LLWWLVLLGIWLLATSADRAWLWADQRLPAWDQADYLNSAVDHGRALGLLAGGGWPGWAGLLDLSPKIPPLSSLVSGSVMAASGEGVDAASWVLSLWHGVLLLVVAFWGRQLLSPGFGLLAAALVALAPALSSLRVDFTLDMPLTACCCLALWLLWLWQRRDGGGRWGQALAAGGAIAAALLIKQSALLVLALPALWSFAQAQRHPQRRWQGWAALALVVALLLPWLHHNWISTLGGTERAVVSSGAEEGDPGSLDPRSLIWYPRLWSQQLGIVTLAAGVGGLGLLAWRRQRWEAGWGWLLGAAISGWLCTSLSPNKDPRYIAPVLPLLVLLLARGWWELGCWLARRRNRRWAGAALSLGIFSAGGIAAQASLRELKQEPASSVVAVMHSLRQRVGNQPTTLLIAASSPDLNEQTLTLLGRERGGQILVRRLGRSPGQQELALEQGQWWLIATGDQGTNRRSAKALSQAVRRDGRYEQVDTWPWTHQRQLELWQRKPGAPPARGFEQRFIALARGLEQGPKGLAAVFEAIGPWHLLDPRFSYQQGVKAWADRQLQRHPNDRDALWSLALLAVLQNRPQQADHWFAQLERLEGRGHWPSAYRSVVQLADWRSCTAARAADTPGTDAESSSVLLALRDLSRSLCFDPRGPLHLNRSLPGAIHTITQQLKQP
jgi:4-amino-4-deoxy-L-arabinose transferase-like glycosyltransferase